MRARPTISPFIAGFIGMALSYGLSLNMSLVVETSAHCCGHFGYKKSTPYMPHLSLLYADLTEDEKKKAQERASILDESINGLSFQVNRLALYKTDTEDKTLESWEKISECFLSPN